ncbi:MAG: AI-2E family transporter [Candidatus Aminicenantales bacterium]
MDNNKFLLACAGFVSVFLAGLILRLAKPVIFPFFLALFFYFLFSPVLDFLTRARIPRAVAVFFLVIITFLVIYLLGIVIYSSGKRLAASFPEYGQRLAIFFSALREKLVDANMSWDPLTWTKSLDFNQLASLLLSSLDRFFSFFSNLVLVLVFLIFMLAGRGKLKIKIEKSFPPARAALINQVLDNIDKQIQRYLVIKTTTSFLSGLVTLVVLVIFRVDFALVLALLTFLLNFIPSLGSILALVFIFFLAVFQFGSFWPALWILLILIGLDLLIANFLEPKLMGYGLGLSPLAVLVALFFWGWLWGIPGMFLAVPLLAVMKISFANIPSLRFIAEFMSK